MSLATWLESRDLVSMPGISSRCHGGGRRDREHALSELAGRNHPLAAEVVLSQALSWQCSKVNAGHEGLLRIFRVHLEKLLQSHMAIIDLGFISFVEQQEAWRQSRPGRAEACESGLDSCQLPPIGSSGASHVVLLSFWGLRSDDTALRRRHRGLLESLLCTVLA